jgi:hypothetical protein
VSVQRKVSFIVKIDADDREAVERALLNLSRDVGMGLCGTGVSGSPSSGYVYSYAEPANGLSHDEYFVQLSKELRADRP